MRSLIAKTSQPYNIMKDWLNSKLNNDACIRLRCGEEVKGRVHEFAVHKSGVCRFWHRDLNYAIVFFYKHSELDYLYIARLRSWEH